MTFKSALFVLLTAALIGRSYSEVLGCGGFVKLSPKFRESLPSSSASAAPIDFTKISVQLLARGTSEVKMSTECSPTGYFFVPSYDAGDFDLGVLDTANGDDALTFAPSRIPVTIGNAENSKNNNFEFEITGVSVKGQITGIENIPGNDVIVTLVSSSSKSVVASVNAEQNSGIFKFKNVLPGSYEISAVRPGWRFESSYVTVDVIGAPVTAAPALRVIGYDVTGSVLIGNPDKKNGLGNVLIALYGDSSFQTVKGSGNGDDVTVPVPQSYEGKFLLGTAVSADATGIFSFEGVPAGTFVAVPHFSGKSAGYEMAQKSAVLTVSEKSAAFSEPFRVTGFSVKGRVVDSANNGISDVTVRLGKLGSATTDVNGEYLISGLSATLAGTTSKIVAQKAHYLFETEKVITLTSKLPDIHILKYDVCGKVTVIVPPSTSSKGYPRTITVTSSATSSDVTTVKTDATGSFCTPLAPGEYTLAVDAALEMEPKQLAVTVASAPVLSGVEFRQKTLSVAGEVRGVAPVASRKVVGVSLSGGKKRAEAVIEAGSAVGTFVFEGLVAGKYTIAIDGGDKDREWCWDKAEQAIEVSSNNKAPKVVFEQKGYRMAVTASHALQAAVSLDGSKDKETVFDVSPASPASLCVDKAGTYTLRVITEGYEFDSATYKFTTSEPKPIAIKVVRYRVAGTITASTAEIAASISVGTAEGIPVTTAVKDTTVSYTAYVPAGSSVRIIPTSTVEGTMFYPTERVARIASPAAPVDVEPIAARPGLYMRGKITPATEGVRVSIVVRGAAEGTPAVQTVLSDANGAYVAGPLRDDAEYRELFSHKGLVFNCTNCAGAEQGAERIVLAMRLSSITVTVREGETPVPGVLVSVSGGFGDSIYATNAATEADGSFTSGEIFPGSYFVRPMLKEYTFEPATRSVEVKEGDAPEVVFAATRVAFSAYGRVLALDGTPQSGVTVLATPPAAAAAAKKPSEQAVTDENGSYRIRGLAPDVEYTVTVVAQTASPKEHKVTVTKAADVKNVDFVAYAKPEITTGRIVARIEAERNILPTLDAVLKTEGAAATAAPAQRVKVGAIPIVEFGFLEAGKYELTLESTLSKKHYSCKCSPEVLKVEVKAGAESEVKMGIVCGEEKKQEQQQQQDEKVDEIEVEENAVERKASIFSLIGLVGVMFASTKYKKIIALIKGKKKSSGVVTAEEIAESTGVSANVAAKKAKYLNMVGGATDTSDFLPVNPNTYGKKKKSKK